jgi:polar amino acid transport system substrate-binding protein
VQLPQALIRDGQVVDGLQHDIAIELGQRLGRPMRFRVVPRRRVGPLMLAGEYADLICTYLPAWLPGPLQWSRPFLDDGPNLESQLRKLALGRVEHALVGRASFEYLMRRGEVPLVLHPPLVVAHWRTACALSPRSTLALAELDAALAALQADGGLARIVDRYR